MPYKYRGECLRVPVPIWTDSASSATRNLRVCIMLPLSCTVASRYSLAGKYSTTQLQLYA